jgi:hypothetical protein
LLPSNRSLKTSDIQVRAKSVETSKKALKVVDTDGSGSLTMEEAKKIAFDHYGFDEATLEPFFAQADENEVRSPYTNSSAEVLLL